MISIKNIDVALRMVCLIDGVLQFKPIGSDSINQRITFHIANSYVADNNGERLAPIAFDGHLYDVNGFEPPVIEVSKGKDIRVKLEIINDQFKWHFLTNPDNGFDGGDLTVQYVTFDIDDRDQIEYIDGKEKSQEYGYEHLPKLHFWDLRNCICRTAKLKIMNIKSLDETKVVLECATVRSTKDTIPPFVVEDFCVNEFKGRECAYAGEDKTCTKSLKDCISKNNACRYVGAKRAR